MDDAVPALAEYRQEADEGDYRGNCDCERRLPLRRLLDRAAIERQLRAFE